MSAFYSIAKVVFKQNTKKEKHFLLEINKILTLMKHHIENKRT